MNRAEAATVLAEISATWPQRALDDAQVAVWTDTLGPVGIDAARAAVKYLRQTKDFLPTHHEFLTAAQEQGRRLAAERSLGDGKSGPCLECRDDEWVTLGKNGFGPPTVRPCSRCHPVLFVRWQEGHLASEHKCSECTDLVRGSAERRREVTSAIRGRAVPVDLDPLF